VNSVDTDRPGNDASRVRATDVGTKGPALVRIAGRRRARRTVKQPRDEARMRDLVNQAFMNNRREAEAALAKCFADPRTVLACLELVARLNGELP
jgi:hypothetical protein